MKFAYTYPFFLQPIATNRVGKKAEPLPDCVFIQSNLPAPRPVPPTTATKEGRAKMTKKPRKNPAPEKKKKQAPANKKSAPSERKKNPAVAQKD